MEDLGQLTLSDLRYKANRTWAQRAQLIIQKIDLERDLRELQAEIAKREDALCATSTTTSI